MRGLLRVTIAVLGAVLLCVGWALAWIGAFENIKIEERVAGPYDIVYRESPGSDAREVGRITTDLNAALEALSVTHVEPFDVFHPDGHSEIGFLVAPSDSAKLRGLDASWKRRTIAAALSMTTRFPWKGPFSFVVGFMKVDPALRAWRASHGYVKTAAYVIHLGATSLYVQPIEKGGS